MKLAAGALTLALLVQAQPGQPARSGAVAGQVVNAVTGEPVRKAQIQLLRSDRGAPGANFTPYNTESDASGNFRVEGVPPGTYRVTATRTGFVGAPRTEAMARGIRMSARAGAAEPRPVTVAPGQDVKDVLLRLTPAGIVTGRVLDEDGDPVEAANVQLLRPQYVNGKRQLLPARGVTSNDLGEFRLSGIDPGRYILSVTRRGGSFPIFSRSGVAPAQQRPPEYEYVPVFYPAALDAASATPLQIEPGATLTGIDFRLRKARVYRVRGKVNGIVPQSEGARGGFSVMVFFHSTSLFRMAENRPAPAAPDGSFEMRGVRPGSYLLVAHQGGREQQLSARLPIEVGDGDVAGVELFLVPSVKVNGLVLFEGDAKPDVTRFNIQFFPIEDGQTNPGHARADPETATFQSTPLEPNRYRVVVQPLPSGYFLKSVRSGDQEVLETGFTVSPGAASDLKITLASGAGTIAGTVRDSRDQPLPGAVVTLIPDSSHSQWWDLYRYLVTSESGEFTLNNVRPGTYKIHAWEQLENGAHQDPVFMRNFDSAGLSVTVSPKGTETVQLGAIPASATQGR